MNKVRSVILLCMLWVVSCKVQAQDWHYSTFHSAPTMINPAFTGLFNGDLRIIGNYRSQWQFANAYETFSMAADGALLSSTTAILPAQDLPSWQIRPAI